MRPVKLEMSAFGPYKDKVVIPFDELGSNGVYLITGDTGAGKTTIFDAITFALFDGSSGGNRDKKMFRSLYAEAETKTYVKMNFLYQGQEYIIERNPEYERPKKSGEGFTQEKSDASLFFPDGRKVSGVKNVNIEINKLLGIDRDQFTQIAMIAQGDFLDLLLAKSDDRQALFRKIFNTKNYEQIEKKLKEDWSFTRKKLDEINRQSGQIISYFQVEDSQASYEKIKDIQESSTPWYHKEIFTLVEETLSSDKLSHSENILLRRKKTKEWEELKYHIKEQEKLSQFTIDYKVKDEQLDAVNKSLEQIIKDEMLIPIYEENISKLNRDYINLEGQLGDYQLLKDLSKKIENLKQEEKELENGLEKSKKDLYVTEERMKSSSSLIEKLKDSSLKKLETTNSLKEAERKRLVLLDLYHDIENLQNLQRLKNQISQNLVAKKNEYNLMRDEYLRMERIFLDAQAGILASKLEDKEACPVCGSIHHPDKAILSKDAPSQEELEIKKQIVDEKSKTVQDLINNLSKKEVEIKTLEDNFNKNILQIDNFKKLDINNNYDLEEILKVITKKGREWSDLIKNYKDDIKKIDNDEEIFKKNQIKLEEDEVKSSSLKDIISKLSSDIALKKNTRTNLEKNILEIKGKLAYSSLEIAKETMDSYSKEIEKGKKFIDDHRTKKDRLIQEKAGLEAGLEHLKKEMEKIRSLKRENLEEKASMLDIEIKKLDEKIEHANYKIKTNEDRLKELIKTEKQREKVEERFQALDDLYKTVSGQISNKEKIKFETYVQMAYFEEIIYKANNRFYQMTNRQFQLQRKEDSQDRSSQSGLELEVLDMYTMKTRDIRTLSGGESFKAALSLALGLSDTVQEYAGGIELETMFVDEGFGSLDKESLNQVMRTLAGLTQENKLIGIISHVDSLKDRIDKKIIIEKDKAGSSHIKIEK